MFTNLTLIMERTNGVLWLYLDAFLLISDVRTDYKTKKNNKYLPYKFNIRFFAHLQLEIRYKYTTCSVNLCLVFFLFLCLKVIKTILIL